MDKLFINSKIIFQQHFFDNKTNQLMKHFTLTALAALAFSAAAQAQQPLTASASAKKPLLRFSLASQRAASAANASSSRAALEQARAAAKRTVYKSAKEEAYSWTQNDPDAEDYNPLDGQWTKDTEYTYEYDSELNITLQTEATINEDGTTGQILKTEKEWNRHNMLTEETQNVSEDGGKTYTPTDRRVQTYDYDTPWLALTKNRYQWDSDTQKWVETTDCFLRTVTNDQWGNIATLVLSVPYDGKMDPIKRITTTTDPATGMVSSFRFEELQADYDTGDFYWEETTFLRDIKWHKTNGKLSDDYDTWLEHGNQLASATIAMTGSDNTVTDYGTITASYGSDGSYTQTATFNDPYEGYLVSQTTKKEVTDANGSYTLTQMTQADLNGDGKLTDDELDDAQREHVTLDTQGNTVLTRVFMYEPDDPGEDPDGGDGEDGDSDSEDSGAKAFAAAGDTSDSALTDELLGHQLTLMESSRLDFDYDAAKGNAVKGFVKYDYDEEAAAYVPSMKVVVTDFVGVQTAITSPAATSSAASGQWFNLQGMRVTSPQRGQVYVVDGKKVIR